MPINPVTGLTQAEENKIEEALKPYFSENNISPIISSYYASFAKQIRKKTKGEAQRILNDWNIRGLEKTHLVTIARDVCNKDLV